MFQKCSMLLLSVVMVTGADIIKQKYTFTSPIVRGGMTYLEGCRQSTYSFEPRVSVRPSYIALPLGSKAKSVTIEYGNFIEVTGRFNVEPFLPYYRQKDNSYASNPKARPEVAANYSQDRFFPGIGTETKSKARAGSKAVTHYLCGTPICVNVLTPVQYNPVRGKLGYYDAITVSVETEPITASDDVAAYVLTPFTKSRIARIIDNKEYVSSLPLTPQASTDYEYLVISRPDLLAEWNPLVEFNKRRGMRTKVVSVSTITTGSGDLAAKIRSFIKQEYTQNKIIFAVLGGDVEVGPNNMPVRNLWAEFYDHNYTPDRHYTYAPAADMYFGTLDNDWNKNGNENYGEPGEEDIFYEVWVSRFPCRKAVDIQNLLNKTFKYSEKPVKESVMNFLGLGEFLWTNGGVSVWGKMSVVQYIGFVDRNGFKTYGITDDFKKDGLYDQDAGKAHAWGSAELKAKVTAFKPAIIAHDGHGNPQIAFAISIPSISSAFGACDGVGANYFFAITGACSPGQFHNTTVCFSESMINNAKTAVGLISNNLFGFGDDDGDNAPTGLPYRFTFDALFNPAKRVHFQGPMHDMGKEGVADVVVDPQALSKPPYYNIIRYCCYNTVLFGDPALSIWTKTPKDLTATSFAYTVDKNAFTMQTPPHTMVALADAATGEIFATQLTGYTASAQNSFNPNDSVCKISSDDYKAFMASNKPMKVIVKAHNYIAGEFPVNLAEINDLLTPAVDGFSVKRTRDYTFIDFSVSSETNITIGIYNLRGVCVQTLHSGKTPASRQQVRISNHNFSNGMYCCRIKTDKIQSIQTIMIGN